MLNLRKGLYVHSVPPFWKLFQDLALCRFGRLLSYTFITVRWWQRSCRRNRSRRNCRDSLRFIFYFLVSSRAQSRACLEPAERDPSTSVGMTDEPVSFQVLTYNFEF